jgi:hypothetical protein
VPIPLNKLISANKSSSLAVLKMSMGPPVAIVAGAISLLVPALINGFPFVFPDSQDYLVFTPHLNRSPFYGLFIFFVHLNHFIWAPVRAGNHR